MNKRKQEKITFGWWNTSLAPLARSRVNDDVRKVVCYWIRYLIINMQIDFLALGEMSKADADYIRENLKIDGINFKNGVTNIGRVVFDTFYIYNSKNIFISGVENIVNIQGTSSLKIAQKLEVLVNGFNSLCYIFISHWPSRMWCGENSADRHKLGLRLRDEIDSLMQVVPDPYIILLGDYNDEPFDKSLSEQIMATRDYTMALNRPHLLFNPFWKYLGGRLRNTDFSGSYYYRAGKITRWHTFDQMIFSHAFLKGHDWILDTETDYIVNIPGHIDVVLSNDTVFDHLPIVGSIIRV